MNKYAKAKDPITKKFRMNNLAFSPFFLLLQKQKHKTMNSTIFSRFV